MKKATLLLITGALFFLFCWVSNGSTDPQLQAVDPYFIPADGTNTTVTITGNNFTPFSIVYIDDTPFLSAYVDENHLQITLNYVDAGEHTLDVSDPGSAPVRWDKLLMIYNPPSDFKGDRIRNITTPNSGSPSIISSVDPMIFPADGQNHTITITGDFSIGAQVYVDGISKTSTSVDSHHLIITVNYTVTGSHTIEVRNGSISATWCNFLISFPA